MDVWHQATCRAAEWVAANIGTQAFKHTSTRTFMIISMKELAVKPITCAMTCSHSDVLDVRLGPIWQPDTSVCARFASHIR